MKLSHIIGLLIIAGAVAVILSASADASEYVTFGKAAELAQDGNDNKVHVVGELPRDAADQITGIEYNPVRDPNFMAFQLIDENGVEQRVVTANPPTSMEDFKRSEKVVIIGNWQEGKFVASDILLKCPSKYENKEFAVKKEKQA